MKNFDVAKETENLIQWIKGYFDSQPSAKGAVIGISGGKDSTVVAKLLVEALGKEKVYGVLMPNGYQADLEDSKRVVEILDIDYKIVNIAGAYQALVQDISEENGSLEMSEQALVNMPPRLRMTTLYAVAQSLGGYRVVNTCNLSEDWVGYSSKFGDAVGDFAPLASFTVGEVKEIGKYLGLPMDLLFKVPSDGLCGKTDEDNLGFTYEVLDNYIRTGVCADSSVKEKIDKMHERNLHKLLPMPQYERGFIAIDML